jgi:integrase
VRKAAQLAGRVFEEAVRSDLIPRNPYRGVKLPAVAHLEMRFLTPGEVSKLVDVIEPRYRALTLLGAYAGLRFGEAADLTLENLDVLGASVTVTQTLTEVSGKVSVGPPKTRASRRHVQLPRFLAQELGRHIGDHPPSDGFVFTSPLGHPLRRNNFMRRAWVPAVKASVGEPLRFHDLRHTFVAFHIAAGAHLRVLQKALGHTSIRTVLDQYGHLYEGHDRTAADALDDLYRGGGVHDVCIPEPAEVVALTLHMQKAPTT